MSTKNLMLLLAGYALWRGGGAWRQYQLEHRQAQSTAKPHEEARWEGEGGALHDSGPQVQPVVASTPAA